MPATYKKFVENVSHIKLLNQGGRLLEWDQRVYMPAGSVASRAKQLAYISSLAHRESVSPAYKKALEEMIDIETGEVKLEGITSLQRANLKAWAKDFKRMAKLPPKFIESYHATAVTASTVWKKAKEASDFKLFSTHLQKTVALNQQYADLLGYEKTPYDALLDLYEPDVKTETIAALFSELAPFLSDIVKKESGNPSPYESYFQESFPKENQIAFNKFLLESIGLGREKNCETTRLDFSAHPFCTGIHPTDVRLTTNLEGGLMQNIFAVLHESGHAFYELGLSADEWATPAGEYISMGVHESQSRWWEVMVGKSMAFWKYAYPEFQTHFPLCKDLSLTDFYKHINHIKPSLIRIYADEVTYPLHVILRFEIEKSLIEGKLSVSEVPDIWNAKMKAFFGITPHNDAVGCLQDIHWSCCSFGYFPTYALGNIYAAQYFNAFEKAFPDWEAKIAAGSFDFMKNWLQKNIYQYGRMYGTLESIERVTGKSLSLQPYKDYIMKKYKKPIVA